VSSALALVDKNDETLGRGLVAIVIVRK
jgi:hypothetical protein